MMLNFAEYLPKLHTLVLTNNRLVNLVEIDPLASLPKLQFLSLLDNNITKKPNYRLYVIHRLKSLRLLDFKKVKNKVRLLDCVKSMLIILPGCSNSWFSNHTSHGIPSDVAYSKCLLNRSSLKFKENY